MLAVHRLLGLQCFSFKHKPQLRKLSYGARRGQPLSLMQASSCTLMSSNILLLSLLAPVTKPTKNLWQIYEDLTLLQLNCLINDKLSFICKFGHSVLSCQKSLIFFLSTKKENETERCAGMGVHSIRWAGPSPEGWCSLLLENGSRSFHQYLEEECAWPRSSSR